jgi:hypothetical protein
MLVKNTMTPEQFGATHCLDFVGHWQLYPSIAFLVSIQMSIQ